MKPKSKLLCSLLTAATIFAASPALAQQVTGTSRSPTATTTLTAKQLPPLDPKFGGLIPTPALDRIAKDGLTCDTITHGAQVNAGIDF